MFLLKALRERRGASQRELAAKLKVNQSVVSRLERQDDAKLSTIQAYVEAFGGSVMVLATFPDRQEVIFNSRGQS